MSYEYRDQRGRDCRTAHPSRPSTNELPTGTAPTLEHGNGKPLADSGLLAKPTPLAIVPWLLVFFITACSTRPLWRGAKARGPPCCRKASHSRLLRGQIGRAHV